MRKFATYLTLIAVVLGASLSLEALAAEQPMLGREAPAFELTSLDGQTVSLAGLRGKFVVVHFGTDW